MAAQALVRDFPRLQQADQERSRDIQSASLILEKGANPLEQRVFLRKL